MSGVHVRRHLTIYGDRAKGDVGEVSKVGFTSDILMV